MVLPLLLELMNMAAIHLPSQQQQYCLKWNSFHTNMSDVFQNMLVHENLVDVTLMCDNASIKAHKMILAACSPYFQNLFMTNPNKHPIVILSGVKFNDLKAIIDFIYSGEVNIPQDQLNSLLKTAESLKIKGLADFGEKQAPTPVSVKNSAVPFNYSNLRFTKKRKRPRLHFNQGGNLNNNNNSSAIIQNGPHKTYSKILSNSLTNNVNANLVNNNAIRAVAETLNGGGDHADSSDDGGNHSSKSVDRCAYPQSVASPQIANFKNTPPPPVVDEEKEDSEEFEPTKLLEQSMSTPEVGVIIIEVGPCLIVVV